MTFTWWLVPIIVLAVLLILAPVLGGRLARRDVWLRCPACGRELIGFPPEHRLSDRRHCAEVIVASQERARRSGWRPW